MKSGLMFLKRELIFFSRRRGKPVYDGEHMQRETFRQKDWETDRILNLVLCERLGWNTLNIRAKDRKGRFKHEAVFKASFF